jgi:hypothetical protein
LYQGDHANFENNNILLKTMSVRKTIARLHLVPFEDISGQLAAHPSSHINGCIGLLKNDSAKTEMPAISLFAASNEADQNSNSVNLPDMSF